MKTIISGSRNITDFSIVKDSIEKSGFKISTVISGTARGVDSLGERYALENNIELMLFPADWDRYGKAAGHIRNKQMAEVADALIVIILDDSRGSTDMLETARKKNLQIFVKKLYTAPEKEGILKFFD